MAKPKPPARINKAEPHDPYRLRTLEQILYGSCGSALLIRAGGFGFAITMLLL